MGEININNEELQSRINLYSGFIDELTGMINEARGTYSVLDKITEVSTTENRQDLDEYIDSLVSLKNELEDSIITLNKVIKATEEFEERTVRSIKENLNFQGISLIQNMFKGVNLIQAQSEYDKIEDTSEEEKSSLKKQMIEIANKTQGFNLNEQMNYDDIVKYFLLWYQDSHKGQYLSNIYDALPKEYKDMALKHWIEMLQKGYDRGEIAGDLLPEDYYNSIPQIPFIDAKLGTIDNENKYDSETAFEYYKKYIYPEDAFNEMNYNNVKGIAEDDLVKSHFETWAKGIYGLNRKEQNEARAVGVFWGLSMSPLKATYEMITGAYKFFANHGWEKIPALGALIKKAFTDSEYREALGMMIDQAIEAWKTEYKNADPSEQGRMIGDLIGQTLMLVQGGVESASSLKALIKSGKFKKTLQGMLTLTSKLKNGSEDVFSLIKGSIIKLPNGYAFKPALAIDGINLADDAEIPYIFMDASQIKNIGKLEGKAREAGSLVDLTKAAEGIKEPIVDIEFKGTVVKLIGKNNKTLKKVLVPKGYTSCKQLLKLAKLNPNIYEQYGYGSFETFKEAVENTQKYLDASTSSKLVNSRYADRLNDTTNVPYDMLGFTRFRKKLDYFDDVYLLKGSGLTKEKLKTMTSKQHMKVATEMLCNKLKNEAQAKKIPIRKYLDSLVEDGLLKAEAVDTITDCITKGSYVEKIKGYTWHHHPETGRMQLVDQAIHGDSKHTGGSQLWGSGD